ncbi:uncharacterized protein [Coffea arabica]|uniref:Reverse transcriptase n=1 Tax=Coffea arabica TaxID=13443 RepID=A0A6P6UEG5_COFAR|nr:uncharacterized protein LOC113709933 [Coffea arabica]
MAKPHTLVDTIEVAQLQEKNLEAIRKTQKPITQKYSINSTSQVVNRQAPASQTKYKWPNESFKKPRTNYSKGNKIREPSTDQFRKITLTEFNYRQEKGLFYKCAEPYTLGHVCKQVQIQYILVDEPIDMMEHTREIGERVEEFYDYLEGELSNEHIEVSIHALAGGKEHRTFKLRGNLGRKEVLMLIESGSTHCFTNEKLAIHLQLQMTGAPLVVKVANGERLESRQLNKPLEWKVHGHKFQHNFNTLRLGSYDIVLGVDWLAKYSPIEFDFKGLNMKFHKGKELVELRGESRELTLKVIKRSRLDKWKKKQVYGITAQLFVGLPPIRSHDHGIPLKEEVKPFQIRAYKCLYVQKSEIQKLVKEMLQIRIIQPSNSSFASPVLLVKKKDGSWRFCVDYRQLNEPTAKDKFSMPLIDKLQRAKYFTKIDLRAGYHQIRVKVEDRHKTAFRNHQGLYEFMVMPFGLTNAPTTFQSLMNQVFREQLRKYVVFFADILVYSSSLGDHLKHIAKEVCEGYGSIAKPLTTLLRKGEIHWNEEAEEAFQKLKLAMCSTPILALLDFNRPFIIEIDACYGGVGVVLMQDRRPIAYLSQSLGPKNMGLSIYEKELLALRITASFQQKWLTKLLGLSSEIHYKKWNENVAADALSRRASNEVGEYAELACIIPEWVKEVMESYQGDEQV